MNSITTQAPLSLANIDELREHLKSDKYEGLVHYLIMDHATVLNRKRRLLIDSALDSIAGRPYSGKRMHVGTLFFGAYILFTIESVGVGSYILDYVSCGDSFSYLLNSGILPSNTVFTPRFVRRYQNKED